MSRFITLAIHTYDRAVALRALLEAEGVAVELHNINLEVPGLSSGVRVRIPESDLPLALRIVENRELFADPAEERPAHTFLVPVDLGETSYKAAVVAASLASATGGRITFLYSYLDPYLAGKVQFTDTLSYEVGDRGARHMLEENARGLLDNFAQRLKSDMKKGAVAAAKYATKVVEGVPEDAIVDYARNERPSLIVMGTRGAERKDKDYIGSVTAEVLDEGRFTVLTVPAPVEIEKVLRPANILFLSNLDQADILAVAVLYRIFGNTTASVTIVHAPAKRRFSDASTQKALQALSNFCRDNFKHYTFVTVPIDLNNVEDEFLNLRREHDYDLIVVPNRRRNAFSRLFNPGLAHRLLFHTDIPMLVIPV